MDREVRELLSWIDTTVNYLEEWLQGEKQPHVQFLLKMFLAIWNTLKGILLRLDNIESEIEEIKHRLEQLEEDLDSLYSYEEEEIE